MQQPRSILFGDYGWPPSESLGFVEGLDLKGDVAAVFSSRARKKKRKSRGGSWKLRRLKVTSRMRADKCFFPRGWNHRLFQEPVVHGQFLVRWKVWKFGTQSLYQRGRATPKSIEQKHMTTWKKVHSHYRRPGAAKDEDSWKSSYTRRGFLRRAEAEGLGTWKAYVWMWIWFCTINMGKQVF